MSFGANTGPHNLVLNQDNTLLVITDYFLNEDADGIIHFEGDHKVPRTSGSNWISIRRAQNRPSAPARHCDEIRLGNYCSADYHLECSADWETYRTTVTQDVK